MALLAMLDEDMGEEDVAVVVAVAMEFICEMVLIRRSVVRRRCLLPPVRGEVG